MSPQDQEAIKELEGHRGMRAIQYIFQEKINELDSVSNLIETGTDKAGIQALANKRAVKVLKEILNDLSFIKSKPIKNNTYE